VGSLQAQTSAQPQNVAKIQLVTTNSSQSNGTRGVTVTLPSDAVVGALKATLNGKNITSNFAPTECKSGNIAARAKHGVKLPSGFQKC